SRSGRFMESTRRTGGAAGAASAVAIAPAEAASAGADEADAAPGAGAFWTDPAGGFPAGVFFSSFFGAIMDMESLHGEIADLRHDILAFGAQDPVDILLDLAGGAALEVH